MAVFDRSGRPEMRLRAPSSEGVPSWIPLTLLGFAVLWSVRQAAAPTREFDAWWHLRLGREFAEGWALNGPGALTPFATEHWLPTQWLPEVIASLLVERFGLVALPWLVAATVAGTLVAIFASCRLMAATLPAVVATLLSFTAVSVFMVARPQIVSFAFLAVFVAAWLRSAADLRARWWLVPLGYLWACSHGMWSTGLAVGVVVTVGLLLDRRLTATHAIRMLGVTALTLTVTALTPVGPGLLLTPINVGNVSSMIIEWQPPNFREPDAALAVLCIAVVLGTWSRRTIPTPWTHLLLLGLAGGYVLYAARTVPLAAVITAPLLAQSIGTWIGRADMRRGAKRDVCVMAALAAGNLLIVSALFMPRPSAISAIGDPVDARLSQVSPGAVIFNEYAFGGWLEWTHPHVTPVIDGLTESFSADYIAGHVRARNVAPGWKAFFDETGATHALLYSESPLALELSGEGWRAIARGESAKGAPVVLLQRP